MAVVNGELMHERFPKHSRMGAARLNKIKKQTKKVRREAWEYGKKKSGHEKKEVPTAYDNLINPNQNAINIQSKYDNNK